jgi:FKBP-type peptidyl-prolyl cis-trans isomerase SlyD
MEKVTEEKKIRINYSMKTNLPDGTVKEHGREEISFIFGVDRQVPSLEEALENMSVGQTVKVRIPSAEIYGEHDSELVREIPKKGLIKQRIREGRYYRQMKKGSLVSFKILEIRPETVLVDFNKPMAGIWISMDVEVLEITDATQEEIDRALESQIRKTIGCG